MTLWWKPAIMTCITFYRAHGCIPHYQQTDNISEHQHAWEVETASRVQGGEDPPWRSKTTQDTLTVAIAFLSSFRALRTVNCLAWPSVCWRLYRLRFSKHSLWAELLVMHLSLRLNSACCTLSRLDGEYAVDFFAKPLVLYSELLMHTWSQEDDQTWAFLKQGAAWL